VEFEPVNLKFNVLLIRCLLLALLMGQTCVSCRHRSIRHLCRGHISKNKQDRRIVAMEQYQEVGTADSVATFRSSPRWPLGRGDLPLLGKARFTRHPNSRDIDLPLVSAQQIIC